jgi:hypothetical protein
MNDHIKHIKYDSYRSNKKYYDFLPDSWYFTISDDYRNNTINLHTASGAIVAWKSRGGDDYREPGIRVLEGMEHETDFIQSLFDRKDAKDKYDRDQLDAKWRNELLTIEQTNLEKVRSDFEKINRRQPEISDQLINFDIRLKDFKKRIEKSC